MRKHPRASSSVVSLLLAALLGACAEDSLPLDRPKPTAFHPVEVPAKAELASTPGFADQAGGGVFATASGSLVRLRLDGSLGALEPHPGNTVAAGTIKAVFRLGPHSAVVEAQNGLFVAESGWLIAPSWRDALGAGVTATAQSADGAGWLAHSSGLYHLQEGTLTALKVNGNAITGITALAAAPVADGSPGVWFLQQEGKLSVAVPTGATTYQVREVSPPLEEGEVVESLTALGPAVGAPGELWLLTSQGLLRRAKEGWRRIDLGERPAQLLAAGRFLWVKSADSLLVFDADANNWGVATDLDTRELRFLAADEAGTAWVQLGGQSVAVSRAPVPRVTGLYQGMQVVEDGLVAHAVPPPGTPPESLYFQVDGVDVPTAGPLYSLGGSEADGTPKAYSLAGLEAGRHALAVVARFADGTEAKRSVPFEYQPVVAEALGWDKDIRPIHESRCAKCHTTSPGRPLNTYQLWKANAALITAAVRDKRMPADGPMDPQLITRIQRWAASGAKP
ncbi:hypothetical protein JY651_34015 [Pyxidicoccus parkwayensis]|uniref:Lipoprotein n=1 Tax=Pyxidicoccus parkwayensis TaxID=2813578 RepID=A0ABX7NN15_9BACT|nr:hypothetical protein [Pyxidicoccus parkwaysis]QSQ20252.1 hypothetical protein JY651_34015 [Pyxidicoccus parkwaysis]